MKILNGAFPGEMGCGAARKSTPRTRVRSEIRNPHHTRTRKIANFRTISHRTISHKIAPSNENHQKRPNSSLFKLFLHIICIEVAIFGSFEGNLVII